MKLKWQVFTIALLSLSFPVVVWLVFWQLNLSYQNNLLTTTGKQADVLQSSLEQQSSDNPSHFSGLITSSLSAEVSIDGRDDDWQDIPWYQSDQQLSFKLGADNSHYYVWIQVTDDTPLIVADRSDHNSGDTLTLAYQLQDVMTRVILNRQAEGVVVNRMGQPLQAWWHETAGGYRLEAKLAKGQLQKLGMVATDRSPNHTDRHYGHYQNNYIQLQKLFIADNEWQSRLQKLTPKDSRLTLVDTSQRIYYDINKINQTQVDADWLTTVLYPIIFATDNNKRQINNLNQQQVSRAFANGEMLFTVAHPESHITLIETFIKAIGVLIGIALLLLLLFFIYALLLTWRVRRLSRRLEHVLDDSGAIDSQLPSLKAGDEIGDLARGMNQLLQQIDAYTDYLKQLGQRLSHEMKTPIGIVQSSLDNIELAALNPEQHVFVERALNANHRLKFILNQLSRLSQLQRSISDTSYQTYDLNNLLNDLVPAYRSPRHKIDFQGPTHAIRIQGNPELMAQLLDKLIENGLDFADNNSALTLKLSVTNNPDRYRLSVCNQGPPIKAEQIPQLFDALQSFRSQKDKRPHLGIGLYMVKLIAQFHQADITVRNQSQPVGVCFELSGSIIGTTSNSEL